MGVGPGEADQVDKLAKLRRAMHDTCTLGRNTNDAIIENVGGIVPSSLLSFFLRLPVFLVGATLCHRSSCTSTTDLSARGPAPRST